MSNILKVLRDSIDIEGRVLQRLGLRSVPVTIRVLTQKKDDDNLGVRGTVQNSDTVIKPNPEVRKVSLAMMYEKDGYVQLGDMQAWISGNYDMPSYMNRDDVFLVCQGQLWKIVQVNGDPSEDMPTRWKVLMRLHVTADQGAV